MIHLDNAPLGKGPTDFSHQNTILSMISRKGLLSSMAPNLWDFGETEWRRIMKTFADQAYELLRQVPKGRVTTNKEIAHALGTKAYRSVGQAMKHNPYAPEVP